MCYHECGSVGPTTNAIHPENFPVREVIEALRKRSHLFPVLLIAICALLVHPAPARASNLSQDEALRLAIMMVDRINRDRADAGLAAVELDELASQVAAAHCQEMLDGGYFSHWNSQGLKPYQRYSLAGGTDYLAENVYDYQTTGTLDQSLSGIAAIMLRAQDSFMAEGPEGGHRKNILDPHHTHVGIGLAFSNNSLLMAQEFLNRYVSLEQCPAQVTLDQQVSVQGGVLGKGELLSVTVFHESLPKEMSLKELRETSAYSLPNERVDLFPLLPLGWHYSDGGTGDVTVFDDGSFSFLVPFYAGEGAYTLIVWVRTPAGEVAPATSFSILASKS
jgi:uncharacterized protein YkwD